MPIESEDAAEDRRAAAVMGLPVSVTQQRNFAVAGAHIVFGGGAADERLHAEDIESIWRDVVAAQALRLRFAGKYDVADSGSGDDVEDGGLLRDFVELFRCIDVPAAFWPLRAA